MEATKTPELFLVIKHVNKQLEDIHNELADPNLNPFQKNYLMPENVSAGANAYIFKDSA